MGVLGTTVSTCPNTYRHPKTTSPALPILPFPPIFECLEIIHGQYGKVRTQKPSQRSDLKTKKHPSESNKAEG